MDTIETQVETALAELEVPTQTSLMDGEVYLHPDLCTICETYGFVAVSNRDGFTYVIHPTEGELLFSDYLKKQAKTKVSTLRPA